MTKVSNWVARGTIANHLICLNLKRHERLNPSPIKKITKTKNIKNGINKGVIQSMIDHWNAIINIVNMDIQTANFVLFSIPLIIDVLIIFSYSFEELKA
ncbi:hypothetical protein [Pseudoalteromonas phenolica]|uniref:hypothetical protein n=1 Tax=Pseudoalteromonas phenolica TaxID=161398 RepID=UPI00110AD8EC|nr:hypothetical protein [Pseudoalteromonas phenolica]